MITPIPRIAEIGIPDEVRRAEGTVWCAISETSASLEYSGDNICSERGGIICEALHFQPHLLRSGQFPGKFRRIVQGTYHRESANLGRDRQLAPSCVGKFLVTYNIVGTAETLFTLQPLDPLQRNLLRIFRKQLAPPRKPSSFGFLDGARS